MTTTRGRRAPTRRALIGFGIAALAVFAGTTAADAAQFEKVVHYSDSATDNFELCGFDVHWEGEFSGTFAIRTGRGALNGAFFGRDNYSRVETYTNTANGKWFTVSANGVVQDIKATVVDGSVVEFVTHEVGQPFVVTNMDGQVVLRDRGRLEFTYLFDTEGDDVPGGIFLGDTDFQMSGPHPGFDLGDVCPGIVNLIG